MRFKVTIDAVTDNDDEPPAHLGCAVVTVSDQDPEGAMIAAEAKAMDQLWDSRLDCTCHPRVLIQEAPRYLVVDGWDHLCDGGDILNVRFVYDYETGRVEHLQTQFAHSVAGWTVANEALRLDVEDSLENANAGALETPEDWGGETSQVLPKWSQVAEQSTVAPTTERQKDVVMADRYVVEVLCTGMAFVRSKYGGASVQEAQIAEDALRANDSAWVNPTAAKETRVRDTLMGTTYSRMFAANQ